jgi:hypothetical protein
MATSKVKGMNIFRIVGDVQGLMGWTLLRNA